jgi:O-antigen/teichoic acid export membrane protein
MRECSTAVTARHAASVATQIRGSGMILGANVLAVGLEFVSQIVAVRALSRSDYGALAYALAAVLLLQTLCKCGLPDTVARFIPIERANGGPGRVLGVILVALAGVLGLGGVILCAVWVLAPLVADRLIAAQPLELLMILAVLIPLEALTAVLTGVFASYTNPQAIILRAVLAPALKLAVTSALFWRGADVRFLAQGYVAVNLLGAAVSCWLCLATLRQDGLLDRHVRTAVQWPVRDLLSFAPSLLITALVWILLDASDALLLGYFAGTEAVAVLRAITPLAHVNQVIVGSFVVLYIPFAAAYVVRHDRTGVQQIYVRTAAWLTALSFPAFLLTFVFARQVVTTLYGPAYASSVPILMLLSAGYFVQAMTGFNGLTIKIYGHLKYAITIDVLACVLNVAINMVCIPRWGALGAAVGTSLTLLIHNGLKQGGMQRLTGVHLYERHYIRLLATALVLVAGALLVNQLCGVNTLAGCALVAGASAVLMYSARDALQVAEMFPEVRRVPLVRHVLARGMR